MTNEDYDMLATENKQMAEVFASLGISKEQLDDLCYGGSEAVIETKKLVEINILGRLKEKLSCMDSDQIFDFTHNGEGV